MATSEEKTTSASTPITTTPSTKKAQRRIRAFFSAIFGIIAVVLILVSILAFWLNRTITDTATYTSTVSQLASRPDVQNFLVNKTSDALLKGDSVPIQELANNLLTPEQIVGKTDEQLKTEVTPVVEDSLRGVIASPEFAKIWEENNKAIHDQLVTQLKSDSSIIQLDFGSILAGPVELLGGTKLAFAKDTFTLQADSGKTTLEGKQLNDVRNAYNNTQKAVQAIIVVAILATALSIFISNNRTKVARRIVLFTGIFSAITAFLLGIVYAARSSSGGDKDQTIMLALAEILVHNLLIAFIVVAVLCIGTVVGFKVYSKKAVSNQTSEKPNDTDYPGDLT